MPVTCESILLFCSPRRQKCSRAFPLFFVNRHATFHISRFLFFFGYSDNQTGLQRHRSIHYLASQRSEASQNIYFLGWTKTIPLQLTNGYNASRILLLFYPSSKVSKFVGLSIFTIGRSTSFKSAGFSLIMPLFSILLFSCFLRVQCQIPQSTVTAPSSFRFMDLFF